MKSVEGDGYVLLEDIAYTSEDSRENSQSYREAKHSLDLYLPCANKSDAQSVTQSAQSAIDHGARGLVVGEAAAARWSSSYTAAGGSAGTGGTGTTSCTAIRLISDGHSAGGHLVSLLTLDERYLLSEGLSISNIKGVISVSGVYDLLNLNWGIWKYVYLHPTFGHDPQCWKEASPLHRLETHRNSPTPPFLILCAKLDLHLRKESKIFQQSLRDAGVSCDRFLMEKTNHFSIIYHLERNLGEDKSLMEHCFSFISFNCEVTGK
ncbi:hypothetical protein ScPMuIL_000286 [Solemya velum]